jgi:hypothetical protein
MTEADLRILLAAGVVVAGMTVPTWLYACYRYPAKIAQRLTDHTPLVRVPGRYEEDRAA